MKWVGNSYPRSFISIKFIKEGVAINIGRAVWLIVGTKVDCFKNEGNDWSRLGYSYASMIYQRRRVYSVRDKGENPRWWYLFFDRQTFMQYAGFSAGELTPCFEPLLRILYQEKLCHLRHMPRPWLECTFIRDPGVRRPGYKATFVPTPDSDTVMTTSARMEWLHGYDHSQRLLQLNSETC